MNEFVKYIIYEIKNSLLQVLFVIGIAVFALSYLLIRYRHTYGHPYKINWKKVLPISLFVAYLLIVEYATIGRGSDMLGRYNLHLFRAWKEAWLNYSLTIWLNLLLNILLFVPLGVFAPILWPSLRKGYKMLLLGFGVSLFIETTQLIAGKGLFDVDDLLCNTLGSLIGYCFTMAIFSVVVSKEKRMAACVKYAILALIPIGMIAGIFIRYSLQDYGNIPSRAVFTINAAKIDWSSDCVMPKTEDTAPIYYKKALTKAECNQLALTIGQNIGANFDSIIHYDKEIRYIDHSGHNLTLFPADGSYTYSLLSFEPCVGGELDRERVEKALKLCGISIPNSAIFQADGAGWYTFTVNQVIEKDCMIDGILRCRISGDSDIREIRNQLAGYQFHCTTDVISAEAAYQSLKSGRVWVEEEVLQHKTKSAKVLACHLMYKLDTKGFYRPVYEFNVLLGDYTTTISIYSYKISK